MAAHQAPPSLGFSRQEQWSGLPFPSPMHSGKGKTMELVNGLVVARGWKWSAQVDF